MIFFLDCIVRYCDLIFDSAPQQNTINNDPLIYFQEGDEWFPGVVSRTHFVDDEMLYDGESLSCSQVTFRNYTNDKLCSRIYVSHAGFLMLPHGYDQNNASFNHNLVIGDKVLAMWIQTEWQYFPATIKKILPNLEYMIEWEDKDPSGIMFSHVIFVFVVCFNLSN